jgi:hypothetical protein
MPEIELHLKAQPVAGAMAEGQTQPLRHRPVDTAALRQQVGEKSRRHAKVTRQLRPRHSQAGQDVLAQDLSRMRRLRLVFAQVSVHGCLHWFGCNSANPSILKQFAKIIVDQRHHCG